MQLCRQCLNADSQIFLITTVDGCEAMRTLWKVTLVHIDVTQNGVAG